MATSEDLARKARAAARGSWPIRAYRLGEEPDDDLSSTTTASERIEMMWLLALDAWTTSGIPIPDYPRHQAPIRVIRPGDRSKGKAKDLADVELLERRSPDEPSRPGGTR